VIPLPSSFQKQNNKCIFILSLGYCVLCYKDPLSLYPNLLAWQVPKSRVVDNGVKEIVGLVSHTLMPMW
jgi:hypothetical protein